jgi:hypothetical protein
MCLQQAWIVIQIMVRGFREGKVIEYNYFIIAHRYETNRSVFIMQACLIIGFIVGYIAQIPGMRVSV